MNGAFIILQFSFFLEKPPLLQTSTFKMQSGNIIGHFGSYYTGVPTYNYYYILVTSALVLGCKSMPPPEPWFIEDAELVVRRRLNRVWRERAHPTSHHHDRKIVCRGPRRLDTHSSIFDSLLYRSSCPHSLPWDRNEIRVVEATPREVCRIPILHECDDAHPIKLPCRS